MHEDASIEELKSQFKGGIVEISSFEMQKMIGKGGFGEVWKAIHKPTNTVCAVKKLFLQESDTDDESIELYVREVKILAQMKNLFCLRVTRIFYPTTVHNCHPIHPKWQLIRLCMQPLVEASFGTNKFNLDRNGCFVWSNEAPRNGINTQRSEIAQHPSRPAFTSLHL